MSAAAFESELRSLLGDGAVMLLDIFNAKNIRELRDAMPHCVRDTSWITDLESVFNRLVERGVTNIVFDPSLMRGFDYYTGIVFEIFDTSPENNRSLFGGGRYDNLLELFSDDRVPAVGFGMGDVTIRDFLETHGLLPELSSTTSIMVCVVDEASQHGAQILAGTLREGGINVAVYEGGKKDW